MKDVLTLKVLNRFLILLDPITCYQCRDFAENTTCANPVPVEPDPEVELDLWVTLAPDLPTITCKKGACVKWTYYLNGRYRKRPNKMKCKTGQTTLQKVWKLKFLRFHKAHRIKIKKKRIHQKLIIAKRTSKTYTGKKCNKQIS